MSTTIWKYPLKITDKQILQMPEGAKLLSAQMQGNTLCLWALVNPGAPTQPREIEVFGTGNPMLVQLGDCAFGAQVERHYISTAIAGALVWHIFERVW